MIICVFKYIHLNTFDSSVQHVLQHAYFYMNLIIYVIFTCNIKFI
jgi:hypothetical protein